MAGSSMQCALVATFISNTMRETNLAVDQPLVSRIMERSYSLPFARFERYTPCGRPEDIAAALEPYVAAGCRRFNFVPEAPDLEHAIAAIAAVRRLLG